MKKKKTYYIVAAVLIVLALILAGTMDYNDAKETAEYWEEQVK